MFRLSDVRVGNGGHGGFQDVAFFSSVLDFCDIVDLSSLYIAVFFIIIYYFFYKTDSLEVYIVHPFRLWDPPVSLCTFSFMAQPSPSTSVRLPLRALLAGCPAFVSPCTPSSFSDSLNKDLDKRRCSPPPTLCSPFPPSLPALVCQHYICLIR